MPNQATESQPFTIYYDGACPVCSKEIKMYRKANGAENLAWIDASEADEHSLGRDLDPQLALARMHVRDESGQLISGAAAFAAIWQRLPRTRWLGHILGSAPLLFFLEPGYRLFLKIRPLWR
ncbi:MAG: thiol-disulfide oxidoreductase DCC family protein [Granulosicoccus sp.]